MKTNFFVKNKITITIISLLIVTVLGVSLTSSELRNKALGKWTVVFGDGTKSRGNILDQYECREYVTDEPGNNYKIRVRVKVNSIEQYPEVVDAKEISRGKYLDLLDSGYPIFSGSKVVSYDQCFKNYKFLTMDMYNEVSDKIEELLSGEYDYEGRSYKSLRDWTVTKSVISKYTTGYDHPERHFKGLELNRTDHAQLLQVFGAYSRRYNLNLFNSLYTLIEYYNDHSNAVECLTFNKSPKKLPENEDLCIKIQSELDEFIDSLPSWFDEANNFLLYPIYSIRILGSLGEHRVGTSELGRYYRNSTRIKDLEPLDSADFSKDTWYWNYKPWSSALSSLNDVLEYLDQAMIVHYAINKSQIAEILKETFNTYDKDREYCLGLLNETMDMVSKNYEIMQYYNYDTYNYKYDLDDKSKVYNSKLLSEVREPLEKFFYSAMTK